MYMCVGILLLLFFVRSIFILLSLCFIFSVLSFLYQVREGRHSYFLFLFISSFKLLVTIFFSIAAIILRCCAESLVMITEPKSKIENTKQQQQTENRHSIFFQLPSFPLPTVRCS
jgi:uncharacterized metal-binding protein